MRYVCTGGSTWGISNDGEGGSSAIITYDSDQNGKHVLVHAMTACEYAPRFCETLSLSAGLVRSFSPARAYIMYISSPTPSSSLTSGSLSTSLYRHHYGGSKLKDSGILEPPSRFVPRSNCASLVAYMHWPCFHASLVSLELKHSSISL